MKSALLVSGICLAALLSAPAARAQTTLNPDISLIGDVRLSWSDDDADSASHQLNLNLQEAELAIAGYLNPYARADVYIAFHEDGDAEIEELFATFTRGLPLGLSVRAGQYLLDFGKINPLHPHAYSFILRPLSHAEYFGEEGLRDVGIHASLPLPTGSVATTLSLDLLKGDFLAPHGHEDEHAETGEEPPNERGFAGRWESFVALTDHASLSVGASAVTGIPEEGTRRWIWGGDVKYRWKPDRYQSFTAVGEYLGNRQRPPAPENHADLTRHALFGYVDCQFRQRYNVGAIGDWVQGAESQDEERWRVGGFVGFAPVEETSILRLLVNYRRDVAAKTGSWSGILQLVFSLGPHKPHVF